MVAKMYKYSYNRIQTIMMMKCGVNMSRKFRNSLLGFNKDDVMSFVVESKETENNLKKEITGLNSKIDALEDEVSKLKALQLKTDNDLKEKEAELQDYRQREEALTQLSESIGRLYLVAKANAESVMASANESADKSMQAVDKNIEIASFAENELSQISELLNEKTREYLESVAELQQQLINTKEAVAHARENISERNAEMAEVGVNG